MTKWAVLASRHLAAAGELTAKAARNEYPAHHHPIPESKPPK